MIFQWWWISTDLSDSIIVQFLIKWVNELVHLWTPRGKVQLPTVLPSTTHFKSTQYKWHFRITHKLPALHINSFHLNGNRWHTNQPFLISTLHMWTKKEFNDNLWLTMVSEIKNIKCNMKQIPSPARLIQPTVDAFFNNKKKT